MPDQNLPTSPPQPQQGNPLPETPTNDIAAPIAQGEPEGSAAPPFDIPPVVTPPEKPAGVNKKVIATILGLLVLLGGLGAGVVLVRQQQILKSKADACYHSCVLEGGTPDQCSSDCGGGGPTPAPTANPSAYLNPPPPTNPPGPYPIATITPRPGGGGGNTQVACKYCGGGEFGSGLCLTSGSPPACDPNLNICNSDADCQGGGGGGTCTSGSPGYTPSECSAAGGTLGSSSGGGLYCCKLPTSWGCASGSPGYTPAECSAAGGTLGPASQQGGGLYCCSFPTGGGCVSPASCVNNYSCPSNVGTDLGQKDCGNGYTCCQTKLGTAGVSAGPTSGPAGPGTPGTGVSPVVSGASAQCLNIQAFDTSWNQLTGSQLSQLKTGDTVRFTVSSSTTTGSIDAARFIINGTTQPQTTQLRPGTTDFYYEYTIPAGTTSFSINAQLHHSTLGWF